jgi:pimeloyl-ACP methyl ester carboxylesterase
VPWLFGRLPHAVDRPSRRFVSMMVVGRDADSAVAEFIYELFSSTPPLDRGGWARTLVDSVGPRHIELKKLTVPTLVIGSEKDRLLPMASSRRIAGAGPNLAAFVELSGGYCAILERPDEVNQQLAVAHRLGEPGGRNHLLAGQRLMLAAVDVIWRTGNAAEHRRRSSGARHFAAIP